MSSFYLTTPIYYVNDKPHIGHAYTTILGDVITRYHRAMGEDVWFLTGTDEHGQKVQKAAAEHNMTPIEQCNSTVVRFQELWRKLGIRNDDFIALLQRQGHQRDLQCLRPAGAGYDMADSEVLFQVFLEEPHFASVDEVRFLDDFPDPFPELSPYVLVLRTEVCHLEIFHVRVVYVFRAGQDSGCQPQR